jgi:hypothetical protein
MNLSLINFNLLNENLTYRMREPFKRKGIRWLALNGGIRWVSLNEREKAVKGKGDMRGKNTREKGIIFLEGALFFKLEDCITGFFGWRSLW